MPAEPVVTVARVGVGIGFAIVGLGFWLLLLGGSAATKCASSILMPDRGCATAAVDPGMAAPVFFGAGAVVAVAGIATLVARRMRAGSTRR